MSNDSRQLESIIADTNKLIELAEEGHWENVIELEKRGLLLLMLYLKRNQI